jgi:hypothetical protein
MMDGPHIFGFSPTAFCISLTRTLASARLISSGSASINAETLNSVGLVLFSAIAAAFLLEVDLVRFPLLIYDDELLEGDADKNSLPLC